MRILTVEDDGPQCPLIAERWAPIEAKNIAPDPRSGHSMVLTQTNHLIVFGGEGSVKYSDVWVFNLNTLEWSAPKVKGKNVKPRIGHTASLVSDRMLVWGGHDGQVRAYPAVVFCS